MSSAQRSTIWLLMCLHTGTLTMIYLVVVVL